MINKALGCPLLPLVRALRNVVGTIRVSGWDKELLNAKVLPIPSAHADGADSLRRHSPACARRPA